MSTDPIAPDSLRYRGEEKLVFALDIGTTQSAVSFVHLYPEAAPQVYLVNKWPGQEDVAGECKLPTLVAYEGGRPVAYGVEAEERAIEDGVHLARWFKLHLHPESMKRPTEPAVHSSSGDAISDLEIPPLPPSVSLKQVYAHFMGYIFDHARNFFKDKTVDGLRIWSRLGSKFTLVLATPNGWDTSQQGFLKETAILGGVLPNNFDDERLQFVTEGEASVHYALEKANGHTWLRKDVIFAVCDVGGSTVDSTLYVCKEIAPKLVLEEVCASECVQAGAVFVDREGELIIRRKLGQSKFAENDYIASMVAEFERKTKRKFNGTQSSNLITFGYDSDNDKRVGIVKGRLTLTRQEVEEAFDASIPRVISSLKRLVSNSRNGFRHLLLVGGMGESPYLRKKLKEAFAPDGVDVVTVDDSTKKAAAEGAAFWFTKQLVSARAARSTFGTVVHCSYNPGLASHRTRMHLLLTDLSGQRVLPGAWNTWVKKNQIVERTMSKTFSYERLYSSREEELGDYNFEVYAYDGAGTIEWGLDETGKDHPKVRRVCTLRADMSALRRSLRANIGRNRQTYYILEFSIIVLLGGTSIRARIVWYENAQRREGPVSVIPQSIY